MEAENNYRILVVDDLIDIHKDFRKILMPEKGSSLNQSFQKMNQLLFDNKDSEEIKLPPFEIDSALQGTDAVHFVKESIAKNKPYALAFIDVQMPPGMDGIETIKRIWEIDPEIQMVICTAYAKYSWQDLAKHFGQTDHLFVLKKPFDALEIINLASSLTHRWNLNKTLREPQKSVPTSFTPPSAETKKEAVTPKDRFEEALEAIKKLNKKLEKNREL